MRQFYPKCPHCDLEFRPGIFWNQANYCRGRFLLPVIEANPGLSTWELHQKSGMPYALVSKGIAKLRDWELVVFESEDRDQGGIRYRYIVEPQWRETVRAWDEWDLNLMAVEGV